MRFLTRLFGWFTLLSLLFWAGAGIYILRAQTVLPPPSQWPLHYAACLERWAESRPEMEKACADFYALLGDRSAPLWNRFKQQTQGRLSDQVVETYLRLAPPLQPGQTVGGGEILRTLGTQRIAGMVYDLVARADRVPSRRRLVQGRCRVETMLRQPELGETAVLQACASRN